MCESCDGAEMQQIVLPETLLNKLVTIITTYGLLSSKPGLMAFGPTIFPFLMMTKHMELLQILWEETSSESPPKHMHILKYDIKELNAIIKAYIGYDNLALMPTIYAYQEYRVIKVYAQMVSDCTHLLHYSLLHSTFIM